MNTPRSTKRLEQLFERELRERDADPDVAAKKKRRISTDLEHQVMEFAAEVRTGGVTPEQMLVQLKDLLSRVAPDVPTSQRTALVASLTGRAIEVFFSESPAPGPDGNSRHPRRT